MAKVSSMKYPMISRLIELSRILRKSSYHSLPQLSRQLQVSERTVKRDIRLLRSDYHAPLAYDRSKDGYYLTRDWQFSLSGFTDGELLILIMAAVMLKQYKGTPLEQSLISIQEKIQHLFTDSISFSFEELEMMITANTCPVEMKTDIKDTFQCVFQAITKKKTLSIEYYSMHSDETTRREVDPYHLYHYQGVWYFCGYCHKHREIRDFALDRVQHCTMLQKSFRLRDSFDPKTYLRQALRIFKGEVETAEIEFDADHSRWICERIWHPTQVLTKYEDGRCSLEITAHPLEIKQWVLSHGIHAELRSPDWLRQEIRRELDQSHKRYRRSHTKPRLSKKTKVPSK